LALQELRARSQGVSFVPIRFVHRRTLNATALAAAMMILWNIGLARGAPSGDMEVSGIPPVRLPAPGAVVHDIAIETVAPGREGLELSARLSDEGGLIQRPVGWRVRRAGGELAFAGEVALADVAVEPGEYVVDITYGAVHRAQAVTLLGGTRLAVSFVLDAGGVRILPRLKGLGPAPAESRSAVFALGGPRRGQLIAASRLPGEILRVPAGDYRIESRFASGNAVAVADVTVRAGRLSAVEVDHLAGLVRLTFAGAPGGAVLWQLADAAGTKLPVIAGATADAVLKPGTYVATATLGAQTHTAEFTIAAGQSRDIVLGD
jgi:hypothetical protein